jgi:hypothetical protein
MFELNNTSNVLDDVDLDKKLVGLPYVIIDMRKSDALFYVDATFNNSSNRAIIFLTHCSESILYLSKKLRSILYSDRAGADYPADFNLLCQQLTILKYSAADAPSHSESSALRQAIIYRLPSPINNLGSVAHNVYMFRTYGKEATHYGYEQRSTHCFTPNVIDDYVAPYTLSGGQIKLLTQEIYFIEKYKPTEIYYVGCAPGTHLTYLLNMFPNLTINGIDPEPMSCSHPRLHVTQGLWNGFIPDCSIISDLRSGKRDQVADWDTHAHEETIKWVVNIAGKVKAPSMFKFRPSVKSWWTMQIDNYVELFSQPYAGGRSYETRLVVAPGAPTLRLNDIQYGNWVRNNQRIRNQMGDGKFFMDLLGSLVIDAEITQMNLSSSVSLFAMSNNVIPLDRYLDANQFMFMIPHFMKAIQYPQLLRNDIVEKYYAIQSHFFQQGKEVYSVAPSDFISLAVKDKLSLLSYNISAPENEFWVVMMDEKMFDFYGDPSKQDFFNSQTHFVKRYSFRIRQAAGLEADDFHKFRGMAKKGAIVLDEKDHNVVYRGRVYDPAGHLLNLMIAARYEVVDVLRYIKTIVGFNLGVKSDCMGLERHYDELHTYDDYKYATYVYQFLGEMGIIKASDKLRRFVKMILRAYKSVFQRAQLYKCNKKVYDMRRLGYVKSRLKAALGQHDPDVFFR